MIRRILAGALSGLLLLLLSSCNGTPVSKPGDEPQCPYLTPQAEILNALKADFKLSDGTQVPSVHLDSIGSYRWNRLTGLYEFDYKANFRMRSNRWNLDGTAYVSWNQMKLIRYRNNIPKLILNDKKKINNIFE